MKSKVLKNTSWIVGCKIIQSLIAFFIGMITARYLGPSNYGLINYAAAIVAFFQPIMKLGLDATLVQEIINNSEEEGKILGTSLVLNVIAAIVSIVCIFFIVMVMNGGEKETIIICFLYSLLLIFQAGEMIQYWFQAKLLSKYPSMASLIAYIFVSIYKVYILLSKKGIRWFVIVHVIEVAIIAILLMILYSRIGNKKLVFSLKTGKALLKKSKYYITSGLMVVVFQQTDRIMLKLMLGETETGYYSAALTCIGITAFVFGAFIDSARPSILEGHKKSIKIYEERLSLLFSIITFLSMLQSFSMTLFAKPIIYVLYGEAYLSAIPVLQIAVWYVAFGYYGMVRNIWILAEGKQKWLLSINLFGALVNVIGNYVLIPKFGACGAALASVMTQFFTNFVLCYFIKTMRPVGKMIIHSFNFKNLIYYMKRIRNDS